VSVGGVDVGDSFGGGEGEGGSSVIVPENMDNDNVNDIGRRAN